MATKKKTAERTWFTGGIPKMDGMHRYTEMIRGTDDPERAPRPKGGQKDRAPHRTLAKSTAKDWIPSIRKLLSDGQPRTLNAIGVTLIDKTADITSGRPFAQALWQLVQDGELAYGSPAPILFVLASKVSAVKLKAKGRYVLDDERDDGDEPEPAGFAEEMERSRKPAPKARATKDPAKPERTKPAPAPKARATKDPAKPERTKPVPAPKARTVRVSKLPQTPWEAAQFFVEAEKPQPKKQGRVGGESSAVIHLDDTSFRREVLESDRPVLVDFTASWCGPCQALAPVLEQLATETVGRYKVAKIDVDEGPKTAEAYGVRSVPTLLVVKGGQVVSRRVGVASTSTLRALLERA